MPRKSKTKAVAEPVAPIEVPTVQLAAAELEPPARELIHPEPQERGTHASAVLASRPSFAPVPAGFMGVYSDREAGIRVSKSHDKRVAAIQFAENRLPSRPEKDLLEAVTEPGKGFSYHLGNRQWQRPVPGGMALGENTIDAGRIAQELAKGRGR